MPHWIALRCPGQREQRIATRLEREINACVYLPLVRERPRLAKKPIIMPLYRTYIFCDLDRSPHWRAVARHPGVIAPVMAGDVPGRCPTSEIEKLKAAEIEGIVRVAGPPPPPPDKRPAIGSTVQIKVGGLKGHVGRYAAHKGQSRARVVVYLLGREVTVEVAAGALAAIAA